MNQHVSTSRWTIDSLNVYGRWQTPDRVLWIVQVPVPSYPPIRLRDGSSAATLLCLWSLFQIQCWIIYPVWERETRQSGTPSALSSRSTWWPRVELRFTGCLVTWGVGATFHINGYEIFRRCVCRDGAGEQLELFSWLAAGVAVVTSRPRSPFTATSGKRPRLSNVCMVHFWEVFLFLLSNIHDVCSWCHMTKAARGDWRVSEKKSESNTNNQRQSEYNENNLNKIKIIWIK